MILHYYGHSCFSLTHQNVTFLFDPFFTENPFNPPSPENITCQYLFVSHGHFDHLGDTVPIAKRNKALVISTAEIAHLCEDEGCHTHSMHLGGKHPFDFGYVRITPAFHGSGIPGGHAAGCVVRFYDKTIYYAGDTALFSDMKLIGELESIDYALLPIGGNFTMDIEDAVKAVELLQPKTVIPVHYNTWPVIAASPEEFSAKVQNHSSASVQIIKPCTQFTF